MDHTFDRYPLAAIAFKSAKPEIVEDFKSYAHPAITVPQIVIETIDALVNLPTREKDLLAVGCFYRLAPQAFKDDVASFTNLYGPHAWSLSQDLRQSWPNETPQTDDLRAIDTVIAILSLRAGLSIFYAGNQQMPDKQRQEILIFTKAAHLERQPCAQPQLEQAYASYHDQYTRLLSTPRPRLNTGWRP